jgi:hypothetical protein
MTTTLTDRTRKSELVRVMHQLFWDKYLVINKYRLLDLVEKTNDAAGNWKLVAAAYDDMGGQVDDLHFLPLKGEEILIMVGKSSPFV